MVIPSSFGFIQINSHHNTVTSIKILTDHLNKNYSRPLNVPVLRDHFQKHVMEQILSYFANPKHTFNIDFHIEGTTFQKRVWKALLNIPSGETLTYGELGKQLKSHARAIGQACRTNPLPILIPCHRIVAMNHLGGYSGETHGKMMGVKRWLLAHEGAN